MRESQIEITPKTFHVWFDYAIGWSPELAISIDGYLRRGTPITTEICENLYSKFISTETAQTSLLDTQRQTEEILRSVLDDVLAAGGAATEYGNELCSVSAALDKTTDVGQIRAVVKGLVAETARMAASSKQLQDKLEQATSDVDALRQRLDQLERENMTDPLTGLKNRKAFERHLDECLEHFTQRAVPFSIIMLDIDHFKTFNDTYGHHIGDAVLRIVSATLSESSEWSAIAVRYGGEEFGVLLPRMRLDDAVSLGDRYRKAIETKRLKVAKTDEPIQPITVSVGVSEIRPDDNRDSVMRRADKALYRAKDSGRNNVKSERDLAPQQLRAAQ